MEVTAPVHISVVLDRSGSMASIADDVVGGFNEFLAEQRRVPGEARVTLAQFDSEDPFELLIDGVDLREVTDLDRSAYHPGRGPRCTTLWADDCPHRRRHRRAGSMGLPEEDQVVAIVTDGLENRSTRSAVRRVPADRGAA